MSGEATIRPGSPFNRELSSSHSDTPGLGLRGYWRVIGYTEVILQPRSRKYSKQTVAALGRLRGYRPCWCWAHLGAVQNVMFVRLDTRWIEAVRIQSERENGS
jgi:hypothetical protein